MDLLTIIATLVIFNCLVNMYTIGRVIIKLPITQNLLANHFPSLYNKLHRNKTLTIKSKLDILDQDYKELNKLMNEIEKIEKENSNKSRIK